MPLYLVSFDIPRAHAQVKTTALMRYRVRPNCCLVRAGEQVEVKIIMLALKEIPPPEQMWNDKFLIQVILRERETERGPGDTHNRRAIMHTHTHTQHNIIHKHNRPAIIHAHIHATQHNTHTQQAGFALNARENANLGFML